MSEHRRILCAVVASAGFLTASCTPTVTPTTASAPPSSVLATPSAPTASSTPTPTPTSTLDANQQKAVAAVDGFTKTSSRLGQAPSEFTRAQMVAALQKYSGGNVPDASANSFMRLRDKGWRYKGDVSIKSLNASKVSDNRNARRLEVVVTVCRDQSKVQVVDKSGGVVTEEQSKIPAFLLRQYTVLKPDGASAWKVHGLDVAKGECR